MVCGEKVGPTQMREELPEITNIFLEHGTVFLSNNPKSPIQIK